MPKNQTTQNKRVCAPTAAVQKPHMMRTRRTQDTGTTVTRPRRAVSMGSIEMVQQTSVQRVKRSETILQKNQSNAPVKRGRRSVKAAKQSVGVQGAPDVPKSEPSQPPPVTISQARLVQFKKALNKVFLSDRVGQLSLARAAAGVNSNIAVDEKPFSDAELRAALHIMNEDNHIFLADDIIFLI